MAYVPQKAKRQYQRALWKLNKDGTNGELVAHDCAKCKKSYGGEAPGTWFERADQRGVWVWVCKECKVVYVAPQTWKRKFGLIDPKLSASQRKHKALETARRCYPECADISRAKDHNRAESILIARHAQMELA